MSYVRTVFSVQTGNRKLVVLTSTVGKGLLYILIFFFAGFYKSGTSLQNTAAQWYYLSVYSIHQKKTKNCA